MYQLNHKLVTDLKLIKSEFPEIKILTKSPRSIEEQIGFVVKKWKGYPSTKSDFIKHFQLREHELPNSVFSLTNVHREYLISRIKYYSNSGIGFKHVRGNAMDISVKRLSFEIKKNLEKRIKELGYKIILENALGYYVSLNVATTFHIEIE